jgi:hypothetical protein
LTETPAHELGRFSHKRKYGLVFKREFVVTKGGQRVWYVNYGTPAFEALTHEINRPKPVGVKSRFFELTPFIDMWHPDKYAFDWEREWRVNGDLEFEWSNVEYLITPNQRLLTVEERPEIGSGYFHPGYQEYIWTGGTLPALDEAVGALAEQFADQFTQPDDVLSRDPESEDGYAWGTFRRWETREAVERVYKRRPRPVLDALTMHLDAQSSRWVARSDLHPTA